MISATKSSRRIGLVGCVKKKANTKQSAKDLYRSTLFAGRRCFVERTCREWWIVSAKYGLVHPDEKREPYDLTLRDMGRGARREWSRRVLAEIDKRIGPKVGDTFEVHAGADYSDFGLIEGLKVLGCAVEIPTEGLSMGRQLQFYQQANQPGS